MVNVVVQQVGMQNHQNIYNDDYSNPRLQATKMQFKQQTPSQLLSTAYGKHM